jgi:hypothetical protein
VLLVHGIITCITILAATCAALVLASCSKNDSFENPVDNVAGRGIETVKANLTGAGWKLHGTAVRYSDGTVDDGPLEACKADDVYKYEANGYATFTHGPVNCGPQIANGMYADRELMENGAKLKETYIRDFWGETQGTVVIYKVEFINDEKLVISRAVTEPGKTYTEINTYKK